MRSVPDKTFYFQAHANSLGGSLETPNKKVVPSQASVSLTAVGGHASQRTETFNCDEIVSCKAAYVRATGGQSERDGTWTTLVTSVVEGLNILEVVKVDRVVGQISVEHPIDGGKPEVSLAGCHFDGFRLGGSVVTPTMNAKLLGHGSVGRIEWPIFQQTGREQAGKMLEKIKDPKRADTRWVFDRFSWMADQKPGEKACSLCSVVDGVEEAVPGRAFGHALEIPHFGKIFLGELLVSGYSIQLSMIRAELGCATQGHVGIATPAVLGGTIPPSSR